MPQVCSRCKRVKYSGHSKDDLNHRRSSCDDGAWSGLLPSVDHSLQTTIPYPQHKNIFDGKKINHHTLAEHLASALVLSYKLTMGGSDQGVSVEDCNLSEFLERHVKDINGWPMMVLDGLDVGGDTPVVTVEGVSYIRLDVLNVDGK
jgi:hypothetical protein